MDRYKFSRSDNVICQVVSKYFSKKSVMDESLSDFQEPKSSCTAPKKVTNIKANSKAKPRKRNKGQRDIRTLVKPKNELLSYSKDFDQICKHTGIDIDSQDLQLAIALSRSLQEVGPVDEIITKTLTAKERQIKIKKTLQEYGFTIPNGILTANAKKRKRCKKSYNLICTTDNEKKKRICNKYAYILKNNLHTPQFSSNYKSNENNNSTEIYNKATNVSYNEIKNVDAFYVPDLVPKSNHVTSMLRDWSTIPGRPVSPKTDTNNFKVFEHEITQEQLDSILSYPIKAVQNIIKNIFVFRKDLQFDNKITKNIFDKLEDNTLSVCIDSNSILNKNCSGNENNIKESIYNNNMNSLTLNPRSGSPDLFDDDELYIIDSQDPEPISSIKTQISFSGNSCMDFTECVNKNNTYQFGLTSEQPERVLNSQTQEKIKVFQQSGVDLITKEDQDILKCELKDLTNFCNNHSTNMLMDKTNDFMEVTDCVDSNFNRKQNKKKGFNQVINHSDKDNKKSDNCTKVLLDNLNREITKGDSFEDNVIEKEKLNSFAQTANDTSIVKETIDLTQSSNSIEDFPMVQISGIQKENSFDDTIIVNDNAVSFSMQDMQSTTGNQNNFDNSINDSAKANSDCSTQSEKYVQNEVTIEINVNDIDKNLDVTQSLQSPNDISSTRSSLNIYPRSEMLGKYDNISIDYDELYDKMMNDENSKNSDTSKTSKDTLINSIEKELCNDQKIFELVKDSSEYNDSLEDNCVNTIINNISNNDFENISETKLNECETDDDLPDVKVKNNIIETFTEKNVSTLTPTKTIKHIKPVTQTPLNKQYIIKETNVTPILDYESMSSPERNKELEKYGIKPFKRKRAIQLLTYIYNQTHPIVNVESLSDESPSTSKKQKIITSECISSPPKTSKASALHKDSVLNKENNLYVETKQNPDIRDIACNVNEWVFQTREKAKVHSCRLPLHIAFHNYVSCRSHLRAAILRYQPISIDIVHKDLVASGYRYNHKDLLKYLDRKCITVKTEENNSRNRKCNNHV